MLRLGSRPPSTRSGRARPLPAGAYLTDGARLFRVVAPLDPPRGLLDAVLEDCRTLAWQRYSAEELWRLGVRRLAPGATDDAGAPR